MHPSAQRCLGAASTWATEKWRQLQREEEEKSDLGFRVGIFQDRYFSMELYTLPETYELHLKMDGCNTSFLLGSPIFRCYLSFRECIYIYQVIQGES